jgi:peptide/nickel transport system substrate-binding protein
MSETTSRQTPNPGATRAFDWLIVGFILAVVVIIAAARHVGFYSLPGRKTPASSLQVDIARPPGTLDPRFDTGPISRRIDELVYDSLARVDAHGKFVGDLAQSFERPTPTTIVFHLRSGLRFSDGRPVRARDVKYTYDSILDSANHSPERSALKALASIAAPDDTTVVMTTSRPYGPAMAMATVGVIPYGTPLPASGEQREPPASGPFKIVRFTRDESVVLARNPYRSHAQGTVAEIVFKVVPNPTVRILELIQGVCDLAENNVAPNMLGYLAIRPDLVVEKTPGTRYLHLVFNFRNRYLRNLSVRRAIAYAIDRQMILSSLYAGAGRIATGMLTPENWAYDGGVTKYHFDGYKAYDLLDKAGYPFKLSAKTPKLSFVYQTTRKGQKLGKTIRAMLRRVGIQVKIHTDKPAIFHRDIQRGKFDLFTSQRAGINEPQQYYSMFDPKMVPPAGDNSGRYSDPAMDRLLEAEEAALEPEARRKIYAQIQELAAKDLPAMPLLWLDNIVVLNRRVKGFTPYPDGSLRSLSDVSLVQPSTHHER